MKTDDDSTGGPKMVGVLSPLEHSYALQQYSRLQNQIYRLGTLISNRSPSLMVGVELDLIQKSIDNMRKTFKV